MNYKFTKRNIDIIRDKEPLIAFASQLGAMGIPGLIFVIYGDSNCYYGNINKMNKNLFYKVLENIPEIRSALGWNKIKSNREINMSDFSGLYLGMGNYCLIDNKYIGYINNLAKANNCHLYKAFCIFIKETINADLIDLK